MKRAIGILAIPLLIFSGLLAVSTARADQLQLKTGKLIQGEYLGGTKASVGFLVNGSVQYFPVSEIMMISFASSGSSGGTAAAQPKSAPEQSAPQASAAAPSSVTVPAGTEVEVRMIDTVDSRTDHVGDKFTASLEQPIEVGGQQVAPKGAKVYGQLAESRQAGRMLGQSELRLELTGLEVNGKVIPISTSDYTVAGKSRGTQTAERTGVGAGLGALIGAIAGGGKGAAIGAAVGGGAGAATQVVTHGQAVNVPSETVLDFKLAQPFTVQVSS